jgi:hypothetical protein
MKTCIAVFCSLLFSGVSISQLDSMVLTQELIGAEWCDVEVFDVDRDNDLDVLVTGENINDVGAANLYMNDGFGNLSLNQSSHPVSVYFCTTEVGDIDGDGDLDLFTSGSDFGSPSLGVMQRNNGAGSFTEILPMSLYFDGVILGESKLFDIDNDSDLDLIYFGKINQFEYASKVFLNDGTGEFQESNQNLPNFNRGTLEVGDCDSDGDLDVLFSGASYEGVAGNNTYLFINDEGWLTQSSQSFSGYSDGSGKFIDYDKDGDLDIVVNGRANGAVSWGSIFYKNNSTGGYTDVGNKGLDKLSDNVMEIADFNIDGYDDIILCGMDSIDQGSCYIYLNDTMGSFVKQAQYIVEPLRHGAMKVGRLDDDCTPDIVYAGETYSFEKKTYVFLQKEKIYGCVTEEDLPDLDYVFSENPFCKYVTIKSNWPISYVHVYDNSGRVVLERDYSNMKKEAKNVTLNLSMLVDGVYSVRFISFGQEVSNRMVKIN